MLPYMLDIKSQSSTNIELYNWGCFPFQSRVDVRVMQHFRVNILVEAEDILYILHIMIACQSDDILSVRLYNILVKGGCQR